MDGVPAFSPEQAAALGELGFTVSQPPEQWGEADRGVHRIAVRYDNGGCYWEYAPWTTYWNPDVWFPDPIAAAVWADVEGWGGVLISTDVERMLAPHLGKEFPTSWAEHFMRADLSFIVPHTAAENVRTWLVSRCRVADVVPCPHALNPAAVVDGLRVSAGVGAGGVDWRRAFKNSFRG